METCHDSIHVHFTYKHNMAAILIEETYHDTARSPAYFNGFQSFNYEWRRVCQRKHPDKP